MEIAFAIVFSLLPPLVIGAVVLVIARHQAETRKKAWALAAHTLGLRTADRSMSGEIDAQPVSAYLETRGSGKNRVTYTVVAATLSPPIDLGASVTEKGFFSSTFGSLFGQRDVLVGDPPFDEAFLVQADEPHRIQPLLTPDARRHLMSFLGTGYSTFLNDAGVHVERRGIETNSNTLVWMVNAVAAAARAVAAARPLVPCASSLTVHRDAWQRFADAAGLYRYETPLCVYGAIEGTQVLVYAARTAPATYALNVEVRYPSRLPLSLQVRPKRTFDAVAVLLGGQDIEVGNATFDDLFIVKSPSVAFARSVLSAGVQRRLLGVGQRHPFTLNAEGVSVRGTSVAHVLETTQLVAELRAVVEEIHERATRGKHSGRAAYR